MGGFLRLGPLAELNDLIGTASEGVLRAAPKIDAIGRLHLNVTEGE